MPARRGPRVGGRSFGASVPALPAWRPEWAGGPECGPMAAPADHHTTADKRSTADRRSTASHRTIAADAYAVPRPYTRFAVRSEEPRHAHSARAPYGLVHLIRTDFLAGDALQQLASHGQSRMQVSDFGDIDYANVTLDGLAAVAPGVGDLAGRIADALHATGVLGDDVAAYRRSVEARIDYLASYGAGFHNDVSRHWTASLFWNLALEVGDVEFVMPHAGVRLALAPGDLIVFDQTMAHGLCRPQDRGQALAASFRPGEGCHQIFLSGELLLSDAQWAALGSPWLPVEHPARRDALELVAAEFDERSGAIKRPGSLAHCLLRSTRYVDDALPPLPDQPAPPGWPAPAGGRAGAV